MNILSISHLFPNINTPNKGVFVKERLKALSDVLNTKIIAPVPYFPFIKYVKNYNGIDTIPDIEIFDGLHIMHPKYFLIPKYLKYFDGFFYYISLKSFFKKQIKNQFIDILDLHWVYPDAYALTKIAKKFNIKIVVTIRGNESIGYFEKNNFKKKLYISTLNKADHVIAVSNDMKNKITQRYGVDPNKVTVIPNGVDTNMFYNIDSNRAKSLCGLNENKKYILSLCRLSHEKGLKYLIRAFADLDDRETTLIMAGDGPLKDSLKFKAQQLGINDRIIFVGEIKHSQTFMWYNAADVFCLPSLWEGCPNVIIESLACGTPVVSTKVGGIPDLVNNIDLGFLVDPMNHKLLSESLKIALKKEWDRKLISQYGSSNSWLNVANNIKNLFDDVTSPQKKKLNESGIF